jgi:hypothetical protein
MAKYEEVLEDARKLPQHELPGFWSWAAGHPGVLTHRTKSQEEYDADQRRLYVLERLGDVENPPQVYGDPIQGPTLKKQLASPYRPYAEPGFRVFDGEKYNDIDGQYFGNESPVWAVAELGNALPAAYANIARAGGNAADYAVSKMTGIEPATPYPGAYSDAQKAINTVAEAMPRSKVYREGEERTNSRWQDIKDMRASSDAVQKDWENYLDPRLDRIANQEMTAAQMPKPSGPMLAEAGVPEQIANVWGAGMDMMLDPFTGSLSAMKAARAGRMGSSFRQLGSDWIPGLAPEATMQIRELMEKR